MYKQKAITSFILALLLLILSLIIQVDSSGDLKVYYINVGQGDSAFVETPEGSQILIDAGRGDDVVEELEKIMKFWDKELDILILSHGDLDHIGGFFEILERYKVQKIIRSKAEVTSKYEKELLNIAEDLGIKIEEIEKGSRIILDQGIFIESFWPSSAKLSQNRNEDSLVLELVHGENEFLFTGDATIETELEIIRAYPEKINSDVLKVGHHGSKTSTSQLFLEKVTPEYSILSYGKNSYGHPHQEVVEKLEKSGGEVINTKDRNTIVFRSDGLALEVDYLSRDSNTRLHEYRLRLESVLSLLHL